MPYLISDDLINFLISEIDSHDLLIHEWNVCPKNTEISLCPGLSSGWCFIGLWPDVINLLSNMFTMFLHRQLTWFINFDKRLVLIKRAHILIKLSILTLVDLVSFTRYFYSNINCWDVRVTWLMTENVAFSTSYNFFEFELRTSLTSSKSFFLIECTKSFKPTMPGTHIASYHFSSVSSGPNPKDYQICKLGIEISLYRSFQLIRIITLISAIINFVLKFFVSCNLIDIHLVTINGLTDYSVR